VHVDARVRALCNTTAGAQCQSLLTTEYQGWRRTVARMLLAATPCAAPPGATEAYLSGIRLRFVPPMCLITQSLPNVLAVHASDLRKRKEWVTVQQAPSRFRFPGGESFPEMQVRITSGVDRLVANHPGQTIVAVSHADPIKAVAAQALGTPLDLFQRIVVSPCSVTAILYGSGAPVVLAVNSTGNDLGTLVPS
jgi:hypothetical protein